MAHVPAVPNFAQYNFVIGDTDAAVTKQNGQNAALVTFGNELRQTMTTLNQDIDQVAQEKTDAEQAASDAQTFRDQTQEISESGLPLKSGNAGKVLKVKADESGYDLGDLETMLDAAFRRMVPAGAIMGFPFTSAPAGWLKCNGTELSRSAYADLWAAAQASGNLAGSEAGKDPLQFGPGDGSSTFTIPDRRGVFPRAWDDGRGIDAGRGIGESQSDQNRAHNHGGSTANDTHSHGASTNSAGYHSHSGSANSNGNHRHYVGGDLYNSEGDTPGLDEAASNGSRYSDYSGNHSHSLSINGNGAHKHGVNIDNNTHAHGIESDGGSEARPVNGPLLACIRY